MTSYLISDLEKLPDLSGPQFPYLQRNPRNPKSCLFISKGYHEAQMRQYRTCFQTNCGMKEGGVDRKELTDNELLKSEARQVQVLCLILHPL